MHKKKMCQFVISMLCLMGSIFAAGGCAPQQEPKAIPPSAYAMPVDPPPGDDMLTANTYAGDALSAMLIRRVGSGSGILVTPFVDMENPDSSSAFGRTGMQQVSSRVGQNGFKVIEVRLGDSLRVIPGEGELMLTRNAGRLLQQEHDAHAVLVGMYSQAGAKVFVSVRAIRLADSVVVASYEYFLSTGGEVSYLLSDGKPGLSGTGWQDSANTAVWRQYAGRGQAFPKKTPPPASSHKATAVPQEKRVSGYTEEKGYTPKPGGIIIDPQAKPTPFPGKPRKK